MEKKQVKILLFAATLLVVLLMASQWLPQLHQTIRSAGPRAPHSPSDLMGTPFLAMFRVFGIATIILTLAMIVLNILIVTCNCSNSRKKIMAYCSFGTIALMIIMLIVIRFNIPLAATGTGAGLATNRPPFNSSAFNFFQTFATINYIFIGLGLLLTCLASCHLFSKKDSAQ